MADFDTPIIRSIRWLGNSKKNIQKFPKEAQKAMGAELQTIQFGGMPKNAKPFKGVGSGVFEIAIKFDKEAYRTVFAVQLGDKIYMLHAFQKKAKKGIETPKHDVDLIKQRYKEAKEIEKDEQEENKDRV